MFKKDIDFIKEYAQHTEDRKEQDLSLCYAYPIMNKVSEINVLTNDTKNLRKLCQETTLVEDGLYSSNHPFVYSDIKLSELSNMKILQYESKRKFSGKLLEIVIREVNINTNQSNSIEITSVYLLFKKKIICKVNSPFNRKMHKLLIKSSECNNLSTQVHTKSGQSSILPLPLPKRNIENHTAEIDFAISDNFGRIHAGTVTCTITLSSYGENEQESYASHFYKLSNDPNDPQNHLSLLKSSKSIHKKQVKYFLLEDPALTFGRNSEFITPKKSQTEETKSPDIVITEQPAFSLLNISFRNLFQVKHPLESSSGTRRHHTIGKTILSVTILRGIEIPIREESALVQPFVEVEWGNTAHTTAIAEGSAPIWHQTMYFELPRQNEEHCIKIRLFDQHPVWGQQWIGEARIPLEHHRNYQELERWITLSPLFSPNLLFGYIQASPGQSCTRIYVLMKMDHSSTPKSVESTTINTLLKGIQRCLVTSYKIDGVENPKDAARLVMLVPSLPNHYGPITPRQTLNIRKVDHYGRATLLAVLLQGFNLQTYVLLGSSQISKWTSFVLSINENGIYTLWDAEVGKCYKLDDTHCPLMKVSRLINHSGIWENLQKSILAHNLKYDVKLSKEWRFIDITTSTKNDHTVQVLDLSITEEELRQIKKTAMDLEQALKDKLAHWRSTIGLTTIFNRHAITILRNFISKIEPSSEVQLDKRDLKQLYRAYHVHGFILNKRECSIDDLSEYLHATKIYNINDPVEFAVVCQIQPYIGKISSIWLAVIILKSRD
ncbi:coiled-coil and C2 domain-containing protein 2A [Bombus vancouverensis nearcticus]|uniref:Coiled-coil and C2 domain-containing protein 2A-like n=1 Tax=Bombus bifarius TaxID=103933 RepID=A0A6P8N3G4_9HYME|nr:coiled-coil and C2 domain-containing protein 2A-like [Bombus vancouverensis nearcticus]XP_033315263.1 coiled-coil and C2 domain-containing protein 2A-like [Bombus bifarius]